MSRSDDEKRELTQEEEDSLLETIVGLLDIPMLLLALVMLVLIIIEFTLTLTPRQSQIVYLIQTLIWASFVLEYVLRVFIARDRLRYIKSHWFDALVVLVPFMRIFLVFRAIRAIRVLRVINPSALARTFFTTRRTFRRLAVTLGRSGFQYVFLTTVIVVILSATGMYLLERNAVGANITTFGDALWYVIGLVTTVGNEVYPVTVEGRALAVILMIYGVGIFGYLAGTLASYFIHTEEPEITTLPEESASDERR